MGTIEVLPLALLLGYQVISDAFHVDRGQWFARVLDGPAMQDLSW